MALAYLTPELRRRPNLTIVTGAIVRRVLLDGIFAKGPGAHLRERGVACANVNVPVPICAEKIADGLRRRA